MSSIVPVLIFFTLLTNRAWIAWLLTNLVVMLPTVVSFFKVEFRGDPLCAEDLTLVTESKKMLETYKLFWDDRFGFYLAILAVGTLALALFFRGRFRRAAPRLIAALVLAIACAAASPLYTSAEIYDVKTSNTALINPYSENDQFISKGFVYPFLHTIKDAFHPAPDGYDASGAKAALDAVIILVMTASMGKGCIFSAIPVGILQGSVTLLARLLQPVFTDAALSNLSLVGSVLVFCVGLNLVWGKKIRVANLLPSLLIAVIWAFL